MGTGKGRQSAEMVVNNTIDLDMLTRQRSYASAEIWPLSCKSHNQSTILTCTENLYSFVDDVKQGFADSSSCMTAQILAP